MFKEIFTGGPKVRDARRTIALLKSRSELNASQQRRFDRAKRITRRHAIRVLGGGVVATVAAVTAGGIAFDELFQSNQENFNEAGSILPEEPFSVIDQVALPPHGIESVKKQEFDLGYVKSLLDDLKKPTGEGFLSTRQSLARNVAYIRLINVGGTGQNGEGSAMRLCQSGYFLTAAHLLTEADYKHSPINSSVHVYMPTEGRLWRATSMIFDPTTDLAILYAPTGQGRKKMPGLQISLEPLTPDQKLWLLGANVQISQNSITSEVAIPFGRVDPSLPKEKNFLGEEIYTLVKDMRPFGGSSGGAIVDFQGKIVAVESGAKLGEGGPNETSNYTHAIVSPLEHLPKLLLTPVNQLKTD